jgi:hypothetical protein
MSRKLTRDQAEHVARLALNYAEYKMAMSNADHYSIVWHGEIVLEMMALLGMTSTGLPPYPSNIRAFIKKAQERLDYAEYRESQI